MKKTGIILLIIALALAIFFMWTGPMWDDIQAIEGSAEGLDAALANAREIQTERDELLTSYNAVPAEGVERIDRLLPSSVSSVQFILEIENMLSREGLLLKSIDVVDPQLAAASQASPFQTITEPFERIPLSISVVGSYGAFVSFLDQLSRSLRVVDVESVSFTASAEDSYEFVMKAVTYWKRP